MINELSDLLDRLAQAAPEVCERVSGRIPVQYLINDYGFWFSSEGELIGCPADDITKNIEGRPALAWLRDAIEAEIEASKAGRGWYLDLGFLPPAGKWEVSISNGLSAGQGWADTSALALLAAFVAALEGER